MPMSINLVVDKDEGTHVQFRLFMGPPPNRGLCGALLMRKEEFFAFLEALQAQPDKLEVLVTRQEKS